MVEQTMTHQEGALLSWPCLPQNTLQKREPNSLGTTPAPAKQDTLETRSISPPATDSGQLFPAPVDFRGASALWNRREGDPPSWGSNTPGPSQAPSHKCSRTPLERETSELSGWSSDISKTTSKWWFHYKTCLTLHFVGSERRGGSSFHTCPQLEGFGDRE